MGNHMFGGCPYQCEDGYNDRNRFPHGHMFVGEIENGKRYPYDTYSKAEADGRFASKQTEADLAALNDVVEEKADESELDEIRARLDALEYQEIKISTMTANPSLCEMGSSNDITVAWTLNKVPTSMNINGVPVTGNSKLFTSVSTNTTYTLNASDGKTNASKSTSVSFANRVYYGAAADLTDVTSLTNVLSNNPARTITVDAGAGQYIVYAIPARLGDVSFFVGGFEGGFEDPVEQTLANASGYQEVYKIYKSTNAGLGETTVEIKEG